MKRKFNWKGFIKRSVYCYMDGAALALSYMTTIICSAATHYSIKEYGIKSGETKAWAFLTAIAAFNAARNTYLTWECVKGDICGCDFIIMVPDEDEGKKNVEEI
jgi:hypothetical protein